MTVLSILQGCRPPVFQGLKKACNALKPNATVPLRGLMLTPAKKSAHREMEIHVSRYNWNMFKDQLHFYFLLGIIPLGLLVFCANVFIGQATLTEIPEGYVPKHWEHYRSPISRWLARYFFWSYQENYERNLHYIMYFREKAKIRLTKKKALELMRDRADIPSMYQYRIVQGTYFRHQKDTLDDVGLKTVGSN